MGLARNHPAWNSDVQYEVNVELAGQGLNLSVVEAGIAKGAKMNRDKTIESY